MHISWVFSKQKQLFNVLNICVSLQGIFVKVSWLHKYFECFVPPPPRHAGIVLSHKSFEENELFETLKFRRSFPHVFLTNGSQE